MSNSWPDGPRDWSPRMTQALKDLEKVRSVIPKELIVEHAGLFVTGQTYDLETPGGKLARVALSVKIGETFDRIWLYSNGHLYVGMEIMMLLNGHLKGFEHLSGRWPWPGAYGPPDPQDPLGRHT
jgi:hypothetical protein